MNKVIWYLHPYAGSPSIGMSYRPYYLAYEFQKLNFLPYVISSSFHHLLKRIQQQSEPIYAEQLDGVPYLWLKTPKYSGNGVGRILNMFVYALRLKLHAKQLINITSKPDVIIVSSAHPLHYLTARLIAKKYKAKLIFEVRDLWPLSLIEILGVAKQHPFVKLLSWIEKCAYREADFVVSVLSNALEYMQQKGLSPNKFVYIPNGTVVNKNVIAADGGSEFIVIEQLKNQGKFLIGYTGAHGVPNALTQLIDAMRLLHQQGNSIIHAVLIGDGIEKLQLLQRAQGLPNVTFLEPVAKSKLPAFLALMDVTYVGCKDLAIYKFGISANKIFDYMLAGKPIVHATNSAEDSVIYADCGMVVKPECPELLAKSFADFAALPKQVLERFGKNGAEYVCKYHSYEVLAKQYVKLFI